MEDDDDDDNDDDGRDDDNDDNDGNNFGLPISRQLLFFSDSILLQTHQKNIFSVFQVVKREKVAPKKSLWADLICCAGVL